MYVIEGIRHLARAVEHKAPIQSFFVEPSVLVNPFGQKLARRLGKSGVPGIRLSHQLYRDLTFANEPQGMGAIVRQKWFPLDQMQVQCDSVCLAMESIESPSNLGTMIRTAEPAGVAGIFLLGGDCDPYDPGTVRATRGGAVLATIDPVLVG